MSLIEIRITAPDVAVAGRIARHLVDARLAACVQQVPGVVSTYLWEGKVESTSEVLLLIKSTAVLFDEVCAAITELHPYEVPEILAVPVSAASGPYEAWVVASVSRDEAGA